MTSRDRSKAARARAGADPLRFESTASTDREDATRDDRHRVSVRPRARARSFGRSVARRRVGRRRRRGPEGAGDEARAAWRRRRWDAQTGGGARARGRANATRETGGGCAVKSARASVARREVEARAARGGGARGGGRGRGGEIQRLLSNADSAEAALRVVETDLESFDAVHAATALHRVAKLRRRSRGWTGLPRSWRRVIETEDLAYARRAGESSG